MTPSTVANERQEGRCTGGGSSVMRGNTTRNNPPYDRQRHRAIEGCSERRRLRHQEESQRDGGVRGAGQCDNQPNDGGTMNAETKAPGGGRTKER
jgi:hypothetical protein